jgi:myo-inositol-1(or 4)-monophosphatase
MAHSLRSVGSAALNFCLVATGALDAYWEIGCWPWDVCAASVIATEAGCLVSGDLNSSNHRDDGHDGVVREEVLVGRKYVVVRAVADTEGEPGREAQRRIIKEFYETVEDWTPN